jgi:hypothetical protein
METILEVLRLDQIMIRGGCNVAGIFDLDYKLYRIIDSQHHDEATLDGVTE